MRAIVLAGGAGKRMGGVLKPLLTVGGIPMLTRVLSALDPAGPIVVVGPSELDPNLPGSVLRTREDPPGGGPVSAIAAGLSSLDRAASGADLKDGRIVVVAGDLPFLRWDAVAALAPAGAGCSVYVDDQGWRQPLLAVWREPALRGALGMVPKSDSAMKQLLAAADVAEVRWAGAWPEPWYDCDTPEQLARAEQWYDSR
jgi:molybdopterin-guanine dinucleotide biosynthesis protein A